MLFGKKKTAPKAESASRPATIAETLSSEQETPPIGAPEGASTDPGAGPTGRSAGGPAQAPAGDEVPMTGETPVSPAAEGGAEATGATGSAASLAVPRDASELESKKGYLDFGGLLVPAAKGQQVRLDIDQKTKRVVALTIMIEQASIQVQPFSAPKSGGTWDEVREQIRESVVKQSGKVKEVDGRFGKELAARVPTVLKDGRKGWRVARFIGFEGPRWFLRGVVGGRGAIDPQAARAVEELFANIVVVRGDDPLPPRELLPLRPPEGAKRVVVPRNRAQRRDGSPSPSPSAAPASDDS